MLTASERTALQLVSLVEAGGELALSLTSVAVPHPAPDEVVLRVDAAPINPSDLGLMLAGVDAGKLAAGGTADRPVLTGRVASTAGLGGRLGQALPAGIEGAGGGKGTEQLLSSMEAALSRKATVYSRYGSPMHKQVYIYGGLDTGPTQLVRNFGAAWGVGGWLVTPTLQSLGAARVAALRQRIADELTTTFASPHAKQVSLAEALQLSEVRAYAKRATGAKYLITPNPPR
jgi:hypothetical protein